MPQRRIYPGDIAIGYAMGYRSQPMYIEILANGLILQTRMTPLQEQLVRHGFETVLIDLDEELIDLFGWEPLPVDERIRL